ncbi:cystathionine gamma-synthase [Malassezia psittaci]|uniref:cystathionine gamma-synthase n=1 Tax=Malassezia psittaci TaxID=1821823 RepID=A0AAF0JFF7_9BASI|nr:cystathionine gamma-synthase [Malassezia psittaci]
MVDVIHAGGNLENALPSTSQAGLLPNVPMGEPIPPNVDHAVSVSLPRWQDIVDYEEGRLGDVMQTGYPRFFIHRSIQKLASVMQCKFARPGEATMLFPTPQYASQCRDFIRAQEAKRTGDSTPIPIRIVRFCVLAHSKPQASALPTVSASAPATADADTPILLYIALYPEHLFPLAKSFWQHSGAGISSRLAEECLRIIAHNQSLLGDCGSLVGSSQSTQRAPTQGVPARGGGFGRSRYQARNSRDRSSSITSPNVVSSEENLVQDAAARDGEEELTLEHTLYVEEHYGRNFPFGYASRAKLALRRRIAGTLVGETTLDEEKMPEANTVSARQVAGVSENEVYLFACGMASIFHAHQTVMLERFMHNQKITITPENVSHTLHTMKDPSFAYGSSAVGKSVCFGFPYTDTLKILQKWGPGCHFFGNGTDDELDQLEHLLRSQTDDQSRIVALFCEFPSNPLLRSANLKRIRQLADQYDFSVVVDETVGNFVNVEVLPYADIVVSSLTKVFSGDCNVMGGSLVLNPCSSRAANFHAILQSNYQDSQWPEDSIFLERNSRDFVARIAKIDQNTETIADYLHGKISSTEHPSVIRSVYYPKYVMRENYEACRRKQPYGQDAKPAGYGGLFSVELRSLPAARAFYDALACHKGPSLGTNSTLACPYTLLAHYTELDWAQTVGVSSKLIRVSVGMEDTDVLLNIFETALAAAEKADQDA